MSEKIAKQWLADAAHSASQKDLEYFTGMISKRVSLQGVPGFDNIDFDAWLAQCKNQFENGTMVSVTYKGLELISVTDSHIKLKTIEAVLATDGTVNQHGVEMLLEKEDDGVWRLIREQILPEAESTSKNIL